MWHLAQCLGCKVYARYRLERGDGWCVLYCPICGPVLITDWARRVVPPRFASLWRSRSRRRV